ncbi:disease resistance protein Pik-2-like [Panicum virgatum]|uniref:NB-ARC domain-containing protein n=1 Tax=Panicum virgatum TaxID=38727 RepID=A0A8T0PRA7_PANVG|nr:disease resistance protein Pik-2-like [Panicum virgatum]KAG2564220.1 hypothetical protein PVAP13_8KG399000 [Panicum virgatum]
MKQLKEVTELRGRYAVNSILGRPDATTSTDPRPAVFPNNMPRLIGANKAMSELLLGDGGYNTLNPAEHQEIITRRQLVGVMQPVGMKNMPDLEKWMITFDERRKQLGVLSIVGFGGVGKTTAALALYRKLGPQFQKQAAVFISQNSDPEAVLRSILGQVMSVTNNNRTGTTLKKKNPAIESIREELMDYLGQNRYLLLIDDIWSSSSWLTIKRFFPENDKGSRIIITTRFQAVATTCSSHKDRDFVYHAEVLSPYESKELFLRTFYECKDSECSQPSCTNFPDRLWEICGGLPLAIITMAGLVASKPQMIHEDWIKVCNSLFPESRVCRRPEEFMGIVNHCYFDLDSDTKTCSLYLSIFPKGHKISRKRLTRRWIAEGFISAKQGLSVEDVAETLFNQLIQRKIIRPVEHNSNGRVKTCLVHDMVLEYLIMRAAKEDFITVIGSHWSLPAHSNKVRWLSIHSSDSKRTKHVDSMNLSHVRSLTVFGSLDRLNFISSKTGIVQVLDLEGCRGFRESNKVSGICEMILLKYLSLRRTDVKILPPNIHKLKYLETLDVRETEVQKLPATIAQWERITNILGGDKRIRKTLKLPKQLKGTMKTLRILSGVEIVEGSTAASALCYFTGLRKLAIYRIHNSEVTHKDLLSSIQYLSGYSLQSLVIDDKSSEFFNTLDSMSSCPTDLNALELSGRLLKLPSWIIRLNDLVKLTLSATVLRTDNLKLLSNLYSLFSLTFSISINESQDPAFAAILQKNKSDSGGEIFFPARGFSKLKLLRIFVPLLPSLTFAKEATPQLERIELRFRNLEGLHGLGELAMLRDVNLMVDGQASERTKLVLNDLRKGTSTYALIVSE